MNRRDLRIILIVPSVLIIAPIIGALSIEDWHWGWQGFVVAWTLFALTTTFFRFLLTRQPGNRAFMAGVAFAVPTGFAIVWVTMAVQIIGEDNPGNGLYLLTVLGGFIGVFVARFRAAGLAWVAFAMAVALFLIPIVAVLRWPADFSPGYPKIQLLSAGLAAMFTASGLCFRRAAAQAARPA